METTHANQPSPDVTLRLIWPQWQGGGTSSVKQLASEFPFDVGRRGYAVGSAVLRRFCRRTMAQPRPRRSPWPMKAWRNVTVWKPKRSSWSS